MTRDEAIERIKTALEKRSGKKWSVTGGKGTAWGWITIDAPPKRRTWKARLKSPELPDWPENYEEYDSLTPGGDMSPAEREELGQLLGLDGPVHCQGKSIPASDDYWQEYVDRAEGRTPSVKGEVYWD